VSVEEVLAERRMLDRGDTLRAMHVLVMELASEEQQTRYAVGVGLR
jgi:hypothetical protein